MGVQKRTEAKYKKKYELITPYIFGLLARTTPSTKKVWKQSRTKWKYEKSTNKSTKKVQTKVGPF